MKQNMSIRPGTVSGSRIRLAVMLAIVMACSPSEAATGDAFRLSLSNVPPPKPANSTIVEFVDFGSFGAITGKAGSEMLRVSRDRLMFSRFTPVLAEAMNAPDEFKGAAGFGIEHISAYTEFGTPGRTGVLYWLSADAPSLKEMSDVWVKRGFREMTSPAGAMWGRGDPGKIELANRNPKDPFAGELGRSSFILPSQRFLIESIDPAIVTESAAARTRGGLAARADIAEMMRALDRDFGDGKLLQAWLFPNPGVTLRSPEGIAPYGSLLIADIEDGAAATTVFALVFADCDLARSAKSEIEQRWSKAVERMPRLPTPSWTISASSTPCALIGQVRTAGEVRQRQFANPTYVPFLKTLVASQLAMLMFKAQ